MIETRILAEWKLQDEDTNRNLYKIVGRREQ